MKYSFYIEFKHAIEKGWGDEYREKKMFIQMLCAVKKFHNEYNFSLFRIDLYL